MSQIDTGCTSYEEDLSALLDDELAPTRAEQVRAHVASCDGCRTRLEALRGVDALLTAAPARSVPPDLRERLQVRIEPPRPRRRLARPAFGMALAAAAALALYLVLPRPPGPLPVLEEAPAEELAVALQLETIEDLDVIANLEVLERLVAMEEGRI